MIILTYSVSVSLNGTLVRIFQLSIGDSCVFLIVQKLYNMKKCTYVHRSSFRIGELYLFHTNHPLCPSATSLWGFYDKAQDGSIILEHSTQDLHHFRLRHYLSKRYRYCRLATRAELRDYMYNLGVCDSIFSAVFSDENIRR